ncbi:MAG: hypothetical protein QF535_24125, partial [Anaerolineales bacterium]|nr:hypothetical protein [Anaerolineales bacterium]
NIEAGHDVKIQQKVLAMLNSEATHKFEWVKNQIATMLLADIWTIVKSSGVTGIGIPLLTNDVLAKVDPRYTPYEVTRAVGGDDDGDYIVYLVNKTMKKMLYWRFPVVSGAVLRDIPDSLMDSLEDVHPEVVELFVKYGFNLDFSRDDIAKTRNTDPLNEAVYTALDIIKGEGIGANTMTLKRLLSMYNEGMNKVLFDLSDTECLDRAFLATQGIELAAGILKWKMDTTGMEKAYVPKGTGKYYPLVFTHGIKPKSWGTSPWNPKGKGSISESITKLETIPEARDAIGMGLETDSQLYAYGLKCAMIVHEGFMDDVITPKAMQRHVKLDRVGIPNIHDIRDAVEMLHVYGRTMRTAYNEFAPQENESDSETVSREKELNAALNMIVKALENYGSSLSTAALTFAVYKYLGETSGTGSAAIHLSGDRLFEVFGKAPEAGNAYIKYADHKIDAFWCQVVSTKNIPEDLDLSNGIVKGDQISFGDVVLKIKKTIPTNMNVCDGTVIALEPNVTKSGKVSRKSATLTVSIPAAVI